MMDLVLSNIRMYSTGSLNYSVLANTDDGLYWNSWGCTTFGL